MKSTAAFRHLRDGPGASGMGAQLVVSAALGCRMGQSGQKKSGGAAGTPPLSWALTEVLAERIRHVVECRIQLVADALHRTNGGDGDQRGDQTLFDGRRTFFVFEQLHELRHLKVSHHGVDKRGRAPPPAQPDTRRRLGRNLLPAGLKIVKNTARQHELSLRAVHCSPMISSSWRTRSRSGLVALLHSGGSGLLTGGGGSGRWKPLGSAGPR